MGFFDGIFKKIPFVSRFSKKKAPVNNVELQYNQARNIMDNGDSEAAGKILEQVADIGIMDTQYKSYGDDALLALAEFYEKGVYRNAKINVDTYKNIVTDLVGLLIIIKNRGHWQEMHRLILEKFPYDTTQEYKEGVLIPIIKEKNIQAEIPKVYYAFGDDISEYIQQGLIAKQHTMNYRSIHYTVTYNGFYVEIQMRTIYDEAWSDCNHNYVYKKTDNKSHDALEKLSTILSKLTNLSNDIGEKMKEIYDGQLLVNEKGGWSCPKELANELNEISKRMEDIDEEIKLFKQKIIIKEM